MARPVTQASVRCNGYPTPDLTITERGPNPAAISLAGIGVVSVGLDSETNGWRAWVTTIAPVTGEMSFIDRPALLRGENIEVTVFDQADKTMTVIFEGIHDGIPTREEIAVVLMRNMSSLQAAMWWSTPNDHLEGKRPGDVYEANPHAVMAAVPV